MLAEVSGELLVVAPIVRPRWESTSAYLSAMFFAMIVVLPGRAVVVVAEAHRTAHAEVEDEDGVPSTLPTNTG